MWLQNSHHSWLLILDNADNKDMDMAQFLPAGRNGSILITTRLTECTKHQNVGKDHFEGLNQDTAIDLLLKACEIGMDARSEHEDHARAIVDLLRCHALAVIQAGAAISQALCTLREYMNVFVAQRKELLGIFPQQARSEYGGVYATFEVTAKYLEERDDQVAEDALQLLNFYAFMHFSDFPERTFEEAWKNSSDETVVSCRLLPDGEENIEKLAGWHVDHLPTFMQKNRHDNGLDILRIHKARSLLASLSLVTFDSVGGMTRMHPVSHFWSRDRLRQPDSSTKARLTGFAVLSLSIKDPYTTDPLLLSMQLQTHVESIAHSLNGWDDLVDDFHLQQSIYRLGYVLYRLGYDSAISQLLRMIPLKEDGTWTRTENGQNIQLLHGRYMRDHGDGEGAIPVLERLNKMRIETLGADDPGVLLSQHELAIAYLKIEDAARAIPLLERILDTRNETLSRDNKYRFSTMHDLAIAYLEAGETTKAISLLEETVEIGTETLRLEHPDRLSSQHELAGAYLEANKTDKAITLLETVVKLRTRFLKEDHLSRVQSIYVLSQSHYRARNYKRALELARSIEGVARNLPRKEIADWNADLIGYILRDGCRGLNASLSSEIHR